MELRQLRCFVGIHEAGSLLKASSRPHVAQPAPGQKMAALEAEVGTRLFHRSSRGVTLTEAGKVFLEHAQVVLSDVERACAAVRGSAAVPNGEVRIGLVATLPILHACRERLPQVRLKVVEAYSGLLREWLVSGRLDLALLFGDRADAAQARRPLILPGKPHGLRRIVDEAVASLGIELDIVADMELLGRVKRAVESAVAATPCAAAAAAARRRPGGGGTAPRVPAPRWSPVR